VYMGHDWEYGMPHTMLRFVYDLYLSFISSRSNASTQRGHDPSFAQRALG